MLKPIGYLLAIMGIAALGLSFQTAQETFGLTLPESLDSNTLLIVGLVLIVVGIIMARKGPTSAKQSPEVPIYHGNKIIGYRKI